MSAWLRAIWEESRREEWPSLMSLVRWIGPMDRLRRAGFPVKRPASFDELP